MYSDSKRERLIEVALQLFSKNGFHATKVDVIIKEAGLTKKIFYQFFESKEDLIAAVLAKYGQQFKVLIETKVQELAPTPAEQILAIFDIAYEWFSESHFYGCMVINVIGEYPDSDTAVRAVCRSFKESIRSFIHDLCTSAKLERPDELSKQLAILLEGSIVTSQVLEDPAAAQIAKRAAQSLVRLASKE